MAKEWASIIKNKEARKDAEDAARIILEHGIKLPRLLKKKGGKIYEENLECSFESNHCCSFGTFGRIQRTRHEQRWSPLAHSPQRQTVERNEKN